MSPEHARLSALLLEAAGKYGSQAALARALGLSRQVVNNLINGNRYIMLPQALKIEKVLGIRAEELLYEAAKLRIDEELAEARGE